MVTLTDVTTEGGQRAELGVRRFGHFDNGRILEVLVNLRPVHIKGEAFAPVRGGRSIKQACFAYMCYMCS